MSFLLEASLLFISSITVTLFLLPRLAHIATKVGLMDCPGGSCRKIHKRPRPLVGGIGMIAGLFFTSMLFLFPLTPKGFYMGIVIAGIIGFLDDSREISHRWKFGVQILVVACMLYFDDVILHSLGNLFSFGSVELGVVAVPMTIFCAVGVINAINLIDGLDGLAGGVSLIAFTTFGVLSYINSQPGLALLCIVLAGVTIAFLKYNWHPSSLFMGDAGSLFLGFTLAFLSISITQKENSLIAPVIPLIVLSVPIVDTMTVMLKRLLKGKNPFHADRYHLHHIIVRLGFNKEVTVQIILALSAIFSLIAIAGTFLKIPDYYLFAIVVLYFLAYLKASFHIKDLLRYSRIRRSRKPS